MFSAEEFWDGRAFAYFLFVIGTSSILWQHFSSAAREKNGVDFAMPAEVMSGSPPDKTEKKTGRWIALCGSIFVLSLFVVRVGIVATQEWTDLYAARMQMAFTLGFHIILACLGVGLPVLMLFAEWRFLHTGDAGWRTLAQRWAKAFAVLFAVGAVSGTVLSFELGLLWPHFIGTFGAVIGLPFTLEGFAFFLEAIFAGIYLYGWDRLPALAHWWSGVPIALSGFASAAFVVTANAWMNMPQGFDVVAGTVVSPVKVC